MKLHKPNDMDMLSFKESYEALAGGISEHAKIAKQAFMQFMYSLFAIFWFVGAMIVNPVVWPIFYVLYCIFNNPEKVAKRKEEMRKRHDADV